MFSQQIHPPVPKKIQELYNRYSNESAIMRAQGIKLAEATWALMYEDDFAVLLGYELVPDLSTLQAAAPPAPAKPAPPAPAKPAPPAPAKPAPPPAPAPIHPSNFELNDLDISMFPLTHCDHATVTFANRKFKVEDYGSKAGSHTNMCFYLASQKGDGQKALAMKADVVAMADYISMSLGLSNSFSAHNAMADTEVMYAYVWKHRIPICVANFDAKKVMTIRPKESIGGSQGNTVYLKLSYSHFTRLEPLP